ncbi:MAG: hypothetical protein IT256_08875 [Chitinophagaceae bacterium]|nr:hypothetical protein [Chitinophagaceae bacterium]
MEALLFKTLLAIHVLGGSVGLLVGSIVLGRAKGNKQHKLLGKVFAYAMLLSSAVAMVMAVWRSNYLLLVIGVFTIYLVLSGLRYLRVKNINPTQAVPWQDKLLFGTMGVFALAFIGIGARLLIMGKGFGYVMLVFGLISVGLLRQDLLYYKGKAQYKNQWLVMHLTRMIAAYIAAFTAFMVVNNRYLPQLVAWLLPTVLLTPLIIFWSRQYGIRINKKRGTKEPS